MEDFTLTMNCGYPSQDVIVGGESCSIMDEIFCPDLPSFVKEEIVLEDSGPDLSSDDGDIPSPISADEDLINVNINFFQDLSVICSGKVVNKIVAVIK